MLPLMYLLLKLIPLAHGKAIILYIKKLALVR